MEQNNQYANFLESFLFGAEKLGLSVSAEVMKKFCLYYEELCFWDQSINLTGLGSDKDRAVLLFVDSLAGTLALVPDQEKLIMDIGSGGGFPGIPLKLMLPDLHVFLMEPRANKIAFLHNIIGKLELTNISVIQSRLENFHSMTSEEEKCNVAMCKGININHILPFMDQILKKNGKLVVFRSKNIDNHQLKDMKVCEELFYELPYGYGNRTLSILKRPS